MGNIIESYTFHSEHKRVVELSSGELITTRMKIYIDNQGEYHPQWEHSVLNYTDTHPQSDHKILINLWEQKIVTGRSLKEFALEVDY